MRRVALLVLIAACGSTPEPGLGIASYGPRGVIDRAEPIEIALDHPAVEDDQVGQPVAAGAVAIAPAVPWTGYWQDRQTMVIEPTGPLAPSTRYQVTVAGELGERTSHFTFAFLHRPLVVE